MRMTDAQKIAAAGAPALEPVTQLFVDAAAAAGGGPLGALSPADARQALADLQSATVGRPAAQLDDIELPVGPTGAVRVRIIRPEGADAALPAAVYLHGGGWVTGDKHTHDRLARELAVGARLALLFVDYDRSPEARYPTAVEQAYAVARYVVEEGARLGVDPTRLAVIGDGVGGNMAAAVTLMAKERRGPKIDVQVLFYPAVAADFDTGSYASFADGPWLTRRAMERFWDAYLPDLAARRQVTATPLSASVEQLAGLPDALVIVAEADVLRDEGECYARKLARAGVRVSCARYIGTIHDFVMLDALADTPAVRCAIAQAVAVLQTVLE
jgi:acetyl esterase